MYCQYHGHGLCGCLQQQLFGQKQMSSYAEEYFRRNMADVFSSRDSTTGKGVKIIEKQKRNKLLLLTRKR